MLIMLILEKKIIEQQISNIKIISEESCDPGLMAAENSALKSHEEGAF